MVEIFNICVSLQSKMECEQSLILIEYSNYFLWVTADREHLRGASGRSPNLPSFLTLICIILLFCSSRVALKRGMTTRDQTIQWTNWNSLSHRGDEWSIKIFYCSQNFTFARFVRKIYTRARLLVLPKFLQLLACSLSCQYCSKLLWIKAREKVNLILYGA